MARAIKGCRVIENGEQLSYQPTCPECGSTIGHEVRRPNFVVGNISRQFACPNHGPFDVVLEGSDWIQPPKSNIKTNIVLGRVTN